MIRAKEATIIAPDEHSGTHREEGWRSIGAAQAKSRSFLLPKAQGPQGNAAPGVAAGYTPQQGLTSLAFVP